jgi:acyl-coenzyme A synthetase/AMP-(fatty) acid ligase
MSKCISGLPNLQITSLSGTTITCEKLDAPPLRPEKTWRIASDESRISPLISLHESICHGTSYIFVSEKLTKTQQLFLISELNRLLPEPYNINAFLTSGSTGQSKIIVHSNNNLIKSAEKIISKFPKLKEKTFHHVFSTSYMAGLLNNLILPWISRSIIFLDNSFNPLSAFNITKNSSIFSTKFIWLNPTMIKSLVSASKLKNLVAPNWDFALSATGPLSDKLKNDFSNIFEIPIFNTYGSTEMLFISAELGNVNFHSCGEPLNNVFIKLNNSNEILVNTDTLARYELHYDDKLNNYNLISNDFNIFNKTNDVGEMISNSLILNSRSDDIVVVNGINYSLAPIEDYASKFPGVMHVCASMKYGGNHRDLVLFYEIDKGFPNFSVDLFSEYVKNFSENTLIPSKLFKIQFPILSNGKIDKYKLRNL